MLGLRCCVGFSLVAARGSPLVVACRLLIAVASLAAEHGLQGAGALAAAARGSVVVAPGL